MDFLKAFSIITIVLMHLCQNYLKALPSIVITASSLGGTGVHIFFFSSGCGLYLSYLKHPTNFTEFMRKRFGKIYIPYILIVIISFFLPWMYMGSDRFAALLSHIFLFKMFVPKYEGSFGIQLWYLSTQFQFYFVFVLLCKIRDKLDARQFIVGSMIISLSWSCLVTVMGFGDERVLNSFFLQFLWEFCFGMEVAKLLKSGRKLEFKKWPLFIIAIIGISLEGLISLKFLSLKSLNDIPAFFGYISLAMWLYAVLGQDTKKAWKPICKYSYEWYLVHVLVFTTIFMIGFQGLGRQLVLGLIALIVSYVVAVGYWQLIHKVLKV
ncbi:acyltransferase family protein [Lactobacillus nasalidis]|uniref:acyltransferase family protein n=1 Tax=Lactobacillus nasalidis TaxID=2797258 RepID=UPI0024561A96|nr:acyltransferase [Lactobacillus nasalidis]